MILQNNNRFNGLVKLGVRGIGLLALAFAPVAVAAQAMLNYTESFPVAQKQETDELTQETKESQVLTVGVGGTPPFLIEQSNDEFQGIVIDIWEEIAFINNFEYELILYTETQQALDDAATGELDLLIGPFTITSERLEQVNFTQPFFVSSLGVVVQQESPTIWSRVQPFFTRTALSSVGALVICLFLVGNGIWLAERRQNPEEFPRHYLRGVASGMWFALVTLTTVGYGDKAPKTSYGRFITGIWMLISLIAVSSLIGGLASAFTLALSELPADNFTQPEDMQGKRIAVVTGTTGEIWAGEYRAKLVPCNSIEEAIALVVDGKTDGAIFGRSTLEYYLFQNPGLPLQLVDFKINEENLGFVLPHDSPLSIPLNLTIVKLREDGTVQEMTDQWLRGIGSTPESP